MKKKYAMLEKNQAMTTIAVFMDAYNKSTPEGFPRATVKVLRKFQTIHPALFKRPDEWSIEKHRKKFMDWIVSYESTLS